MMMIIYFYMTRGILYIDTDKFLISKLWTYDIEKSNTYLRNIQNAMWLIVHLNIQSNKLQELYILQE